MNLVRLAIFHIMHSANLSKFFFTQHSYSPLWWDTSLEMMRLADRLAILKRKMHVALASTW
jgi:hypothetical protein